MNDIITEILKLPTETRTIEFKRLASNKNVVKVLKTIVAMANTDGGTIIFGVDDPVKTKLKGLERIFGIEENTEVFDEIGREIRKIAPPISNL
ncbi:MAG: ATP-binding protein [bacterium]|nr:ATP-binding protein [bacterium]